MIGFFFAQSEYSLLDNSIKLEKLIKTASEYNYPFIALADNLLGGTVKFFELCAKYDVKPVIGVRLTNILLYAKNGEGYKNILKISTIKETENELTNEILKKYNRGIIAITYDIYDNVENKIKSYKDIYEDLFVGLQVQNQIGKKNIEDISIIAKKLKLLTLPINRTCYLNKDKKIVYEYLKKIDNKKSLNGDYYFKNKEELKDDFKNHMEVFDNTKKIIDLINFKIKKRQFSLPKYKTPNNIESPKYLYELCLMGLKKRLKGNMKVVNVYKERLTYELSVIGKMNFDDYFLIVWDFVKFAKNNKILVGPGRGSAAGSLVSYCLGITNVDPIKYNLVFERFLNPERISMPDIDLDFPDDKREEVIQYVANKYGKDHVCHIATFGRYQARMAIRDVARVMGLSSNKLAETIKHIKQFSSLEENLKNDNLLKLCEDDQIKELMKIALAIEGLPKHFSTHAAGIILSKEPLTNVIALNKGINDINQSQLEAVDLESLGLLKIDFLGLKNLTMIDKIASMIPNFDINNIPLDDYKTFLLLSNGDTNGVFQLESMGMRNVLRKLKPKVIEDVIAVLALYRPGPMAQIEDFIKRKNGEKFSYFHPDLENILKSTYGIIVYQEQIMKIASEFAGYTLGEADILRRAVSKKKEDVLINERKKFISKSTKKGYKKEEANEIYDYIVKFANYGFNRNHSVPYAIIAYQMAYLKANYQEFFMCVLLSSVIGSEESIRKYINEAREKRIIIQQPSINRSGLYFKVEARKIRFPLTAIRNIGNKAAQKIIVERENGYFKDFDSFKRRIEPSNQLLEALIYSGALDEFLLSKKEMIEYGDKSIFTKNLLGVIDKEKKEYLISELTIKEKEVLGFNLVYNPFLKYEKYMKEQNLLSIEFIDKLMVGKSIKVLGYFKKGKIIKTKTNEEMAFLTITNGQIEIECVIFPNVYEKLKKTLQYGIIYAVETTIELRNNNIQLVISKTELVN